jgi:TetR/AcrR family transcriptional regulator, transcriptional repressor for nem operon
MVNQEHPSLTEYANTRDKIIAIAEQLLFDQGFSGTSLNDVMKVANLSKGAFFHHFKGKEQLGFAVLERWADADDDLIKKFVARANTLGEDPLQIAIIFIKLFEEWLTELEEPLGGCLLASFTYENARFDTSMRDYIEQRLTGWMAIYSGIFDNLAEKQTPKQPDVSAQGLTELLASIIEGGLLMARAMNDRNYLVRQLKQFRRHLVLLFEKK